ncbi:hypothetical protein CH274_12080 [Rhodococcus sp. 06-418-5]|uniref:hypothetical protein n=1 Tax=Rhodococcus sp. 06-418-5 TaxID=2022507 RepID=UPI000B9A664D|nr:hypothetical protein [Rhodococcus sp. 06-418-5]OZC80943.1 hypothetical protein CH274_12080 [Rhodococcus sp. 06-418-5]
MVAVFGYDFARWWRLAPWSTNPLMRGRDRTAALAFACAMAVILGLVPFAALLGSLTSPISMPRRPERAPPPSRSMPW